jgi:hypothetical protein
MKIGQPELSETFRRKAWKPVANFHEKILELFVDSRYIELSII